MNSLQKLDRFLDRLRRAVSRRFGAGADVNFIGFNKYQKSGAYHWELTNAELNTRIDTVARLAPAGGICVDLGCGDAAYFKRLSQVAGRLIGIDADYDAIKWARRKLRESGITNAVCYHKSISRVSRRALKLRAGADFVYSMDAVEHLPKPEELVEVCARIVSDRGTVAIGTPLYLSDELVSRYHVKEFTLDEFKTLCAVHFGIRETMLFPQKRKDGKIYQDNYCILVLEPRGTRQSA